MTTIRRLFELIRACLEEREHDRLFAQWRAERQGEPPR